MSSQTADRETDAFHAKTVNPETADLKIVDCKVADSKIEGEKITERITAILIAEVNEEEEKFRPFFIRQVLPTDGTCCAGVRNSAKRNVFPKLCRAKRSGPAPALDPDVVTFSVQSLIVAFLVILPLWFIDSPAQQLATFLIAPPPPPPPPPPAAPSMKATKVVSEVINGELVAPIRSRRR